MDGWLIQIWSVEEVLFKVIELEGGRLDDSCVGEGGSVTFAIKW